MKIVFGLALIALATATTIYQEPGFVEYVGAPAAYASAPHYATNIIEEVVRPGYGYAAPAYTTGATYATAAPAYTTGYPTTTYAAPTTTYAAAPHYATAPTFATPTYAAAPAYTTGVVAPRLGNNLVFADLDKDGDLELYSYGRN